MATFVIPFTTPGNYTYDSDKVEVSDGLAKLKAVENVHARWHMNESSGDNVPDDSGNGRDGTRINAPLWVAGKLNNCLRFNGTNQYVNCGNIANFERTDPFSLECWFKTSVNTKTLMSKAMNSPSYRGIHLIIAGGNVYISLVSDISTSNYLQVLGNSIVTNNAWRHLIVTYDGSSRAAGARIYIDNVEEALTVGKDTLTGTILNSEDFLIGQRYNTEYYNGDMDEAGIYDKDLNSEEVDYRFNSAAGRENWYYSQLDDDFIDLKGYWEFEDDYVDSSGWGNEVSNFGAVFVDGKVGRCLSFNGINNYLSANGVTDNGFFSNAHTIVGWGKLSNWSQNQSIFCGGPPSGVGYVEVDFSTDKRIHARVRETASGNENTVASLNTYDLDSDWHFFVLVIDNSGHIVAFYIDTIDQGDDSTYNLDLSDFNKFYIGQLVYSIPNTNPWTGLIDEIAVYKRILLESKVQDIYSSGIGRHLNRFVSDGPPIYKTTGNSGIIFDLNSFLVTEGVVEGSLRYQLSSDGITWYYWSGVAWSVAGSTDYNLESTVNTNINSFPTGPDKIYVRTFFLSDGVQRVEIDEIQITYTSNMVPLLNAGANKNCFDNQSIKPFSDCDFNDPDGSIDFVRYKIDGEVDVWTDIPISGYATLLEAVQDFDYTFSNLGVLTARLQVEDNAGATSEDSLTVTVSKYTKIVNIRDSLSGQHLVDVTFDPDDGTGQADQNSPFPWSWEYGSFDVVLSKENYYSKIESISIIDESEINIVMSLMTFINKCEASVGLITDSDTLIICVWLSQNGSINDTPTSCDIVFKNSDGSIVYSGTSSSPDADGVFLFSSSPSGLEDEGVYRIHVDIVADGTTFQNVIPVDKIKRDRFSLDGKVYIDTVNGVTGTVYPKGTFNKPVNNWADAKVIADVNLIKRFILRGSLILSILDDVGGYEFSGDTAVGVEITFGGGNTLDSVFRHLVLQGVLNGKVFINDNSSIKTLSGFEGEIHNSCLTETLTLAGSLSPLISKCVSGIPGSGTPVIDMGGSGRGLNVRAYSGGIKLINKTGSESVTLEYIAGQYKLDSTVTNGYITIRGIAKEGQDDSGVGCIVDTKAAVINPWANTASENMDSGTFGELLSYLKDEAFGKWVVDVVNKTLTLYKIDGTVLQIFDLEDTVQNVPAFISRIPR